MPNLQFEMGSYKLQKRVDNTLNTYAYGYRVTITFYNVAAHMD